MKIKPLLYILALFTGCQPAEIQDQVEGSNVLSYPYSLNLIEGMDNNKKLYLSDIADSISYMVVMKYSEVPIRTVSTIQADGDDIFVGAYTDKGSMFRLDNNAQLINKIGSHGRGPGEYSKGTHIFAINPKNKKICILCQITRRHLEYDYEGNYLGEIPFKDKYQLVYLGYLGIENLLRVVTYMHLLKLFPDNHPLIEVYSIDKDTILDRVLHPLNTDLQQIKNIEASFGSPPMVSQFEYEHIINPMVSDTIYKANSDSVYPAFIIEKSIYSPTKEVKYGGHKHLLNTKCFFSAGKVFETNEKVYFSQFFGDNELYLFEYDKTTNHISSMKNEYDHCKNVIELLSREIGFLNDIDGGYDFVPHNTNMAGSAWYRSMPAMQFKKLHSEEFLRNRNFKNQNQRNKLVSFLENLAEDDNPVLIITHLKEN